MTRSCTSIESVRTRLNTFFFSLERASRTNVENSLDLLDFFFLKNIFRTAISQLRHVADHFDKVVFCVLLWNVVVNLIHISFVHLVGSI